MDEDKYNLPPEPISLRDEIAMAALTGLLADPQVLADSTTAKLSYRIADWMLEARKSNSTA
jgi:hypothetical protein